MSKFWPFVALNIYKIEQALEDLKSENFIAQIIR